MKLAQRQIKEVKTLIDDRINAIDKRHREERGGEDRPSDIEILRSVPGVGTVVSSVFLSEVWEILSRRDYRALWCFAGVAPVTRQSGKSRRVGVGKLSSMHDSVSKTRYGYCEPGDSAVTGVFVP